MSLYLGEKQVCLYLNNKRYKMQKVILGENKILFSSDKYYLADKNGVFLTCLQPFMFDNIIYTADNEILLTINDEILLTGGE